MFSILFLLTMFHIFRKITNLGMRSGAKRPGGEMSRSHYLWSPKNVSKIPKILIFLLSKYLKKQKNSNASFFCIFECFAFFKVYRRLTELAPHLAAVCERFNFVVPQTQPQQFPGATDLEFMADLLAIAELFRRFARKLQSVDTPTISLLYPGTWVI